MSRRIELWTWDEGSRWLDLDGSSQVLVPALETVLLGGLWKEFRKFPVDVLARLLPALEIPPNVRRLVEIWVEERSTV